MMSQQKKVWAISEDGTIEFISVTSDKVEETISMMREGFIKCENVCNVIGLATRPQLFPHVEQLFRYYIRDGVSIIAVEKASEKIVGALINKTYSAELGLHQTYEKYHGTSQHPTMVAFFQFLLESQAGLDYFKEYHVDGLMDMAFVGVLPEFRKRKIALTLFRVSLELATLLMNGKNVRHSIDGIRLPLEPAPKICVALMTSVATQRIAAQLGFKRLRTVSYENIFFEGKSYASAISDDTFGYTVDCKLLK